MRIDLRSEDPLALAKLIVQVEDVILHRNYEGVKIQAAILSVNAGRNHSCGSSLGEAGYELFARARHGSLTHHRFDGREHSVE